MARGAVAVCCVAPCATWVSYGAVQYGGGGAARVPAPVFSGDRVLVMQRSGGSSVVS